MPVIAFTKTDGGHYPRYVEWLRERDPSLTALDLRVEPFEALRGCDGLVLVGGPDVDPSRYAMPEATPLCTVDAERDAIDLAAFHEACALRMPILAICRGLQVVNVALGGTLCPDLPTDGKAGHGKVEGRDALHGISIATDSLLASITRAERGTVNSAHHQSALRVAPDLRAVATADDGVIEALEWRQPDARGVLLCVQWHPERLDDEAFSHRIADAFLVSCRTAPRANQSTRKQHAPYLFDGTAP